MQRVRISSHQAPVHKLGDTQMTLSPKFRLAAIRSSLSDPNLEIELFKKGDPLIPGLPDDIALSCLLRLPVAKHTIYKIVCKRWYVLFSRKDQFFIRRKKLRFNDPWLYVLAFHKCTEKIQWKVLDLNNLSWHSIPPMPCKEKVCAHGFSSVSVPHEGVLYVCGGVLSDNKDIPLNLVLKYEVLKNRWTVMSGMLVERVFFGSGMIDGKIYVSGGDGVGHYELSLAEVFDPSDGNGSWGLVADMGTSIACYDSAVLDGKLLVTEGWVWPFDVAPRGQVYDPEIDKWENMSTGLREGWTGSSVVMYDRLFVVTEHERTKLKVYDVGTDTWESIAGPALPEEIRKPFKVSCSDRRIFVVGRDLHVAIGDVKMSRANDDKTSFFVEWHAVSAPLGFAELTPSNAKVLFG